jgi:hypothetical protein
MNNILIRMRHILEAMLYTHHSSSRLSRGRYEVLVDQTQRIYTRIKATMVMSHGLADSVRYVRIGPDEVAAVIVVTKLLHGMVENKVRGSVDIQVSVYEHRDGGMREKHVFVVVGSAIIVMVDASRAV